MFIIPPRVPSQKAGEIQDVFYVTEWGTFSKQAPHNSVILIAVNALPVIRQVINGETVHRETTRGGCNRQQPSSTILVTMPTIG